MSYAVNSEGTKVGGELTSTSIDLDSGKECVLLDDKPLELDSVIEKIKNILKDTSTELSSTENIDI